MERIELPEPVQRLIFAHIRSVERLEILLLLFEAADRLWTVHDIERRIRSTPESVAQNVMALAELRLVVASGNPPAYQFDPAQSSDPDAVTQLAQAYRTRRVAVIEAIYADRRDAVRSFSEAFKLGRKRDR